MAAFRFPSIFGRGRAARERLALIAATKLRRRCQAVIDADRAGDAHVAAPVLAVRAVLALRANATRSIDAARAKRVLAGGRIGGAR